MATLAKPETPVSNISRRKEIITALRGKIKTSKSLAADVDEALNELEEVAADDAGDLLGVLDIIEDIVHNTPDAELRGKLLGVRQTIAAHPNSPLEMLHHLLI